jgi:fused signal recognition particle receptor
MLFGSKKDNTAPDKEKRGLFARLKQGLSKTRQGFSDTLANLVLGRKIIDDELLEDIETQLLTADVGIEATRDIIQDLTGRLDRNELADPQALIDALRQDLTTILQPCEQTLVPRASDGPFVILVVGVNGSGKTTTIGKLARRFKDQGHSVMLAAGDTFRAAAVEQLQTWGERNDVPVVAQQTGADAASVIYDALASAQARNMDVLIADTAGRLQSQSNLMEELKKIRRVLGKLNAAAPHETLLVIDAGTGQNALSQAEQFDRAVNLTGVALTKLDGTARGGIIFAIAKKLQLPIRFIGVGESAEDLRPFAAREFVDALFETRDT